MRIETKHGEYQKGFFSKSTYYTVTINAYLSEEEKQIAEDNNFNFGRTLLPLPSYTRFDDMDGLASSHRCRGDLLYANVTAVNMDEKKTQKERTRYFRTKAEAKLFEAQALEALKDFKNYLNANAEKVIPNKSIEL